MALRRTPVLELDRHNYVGYKRGCRCDECRAGNAAWMREYRYRERAIPDGAHGRASTYVNYRCRCALCAYEWRAYQQQRKGGK